MPDAPSEDVMVRATNDVIRAALRCQKDHKLPTGGLIMCLGLALGGVILTLPEDVQATAVEEAIAFIRLGTS